MKFYFNDLSESDRDIIVNLCKENSIFFNVKSENTNGFFVNTKIYTVIVHTDYEHKLFLDFLYKKELEKIRKLEQQIYDLEMCLLDKQQQPLNFAFDNAIPCNGMSFKKEPQAKHIWNILRINDRFDEERGM